MSSAAGNKKQNNRAPPAPASAPRAYTTSAAAAVSRPTPPPAPVTLAAPGGRGPQHVYGHYPPPPHYHPSSSHHPYQFPQGQVHTSSTGQASSHVQLNEANILSSLKKAPLATIVDNPAEGEEGGEEEFGKLSGRKLDSSFAEGSTSTGTIQNDNSDNNTAQHRAPTPLLLSPDSSTDGAAAAPGSKAGASKDKMGSTARRTKIAGALNESRATDAPPSAKLAELDAMTCHTIEVFQATNEDIEAFDSAESVRMLGTSTSKAVRVGQVGFRCVHCFPREGPTVASGGKMDLCVVYPASVGTISTALRHMRDHHFDSCEAMPKESKTAFADARREQEEQDAGSGRHCRKGGDNGPDEWRRIAFLGFCVDFCQRKDIINIQPQRSGLKYRLLMPASSSVAVGAAAAAGAASAPARDTTGPEKGGAPLPSAGIGAMAATVAPPNPANSSTSTPTPGTRNGPRQPNFPFFYDNYGAWICRYCCSVPYPYRGHGSVWNAPNQAPPTREFVDQHMKLCRGGAPPQSQRGAMMAPSSPHTPQMPPLPGGTTATNPEGIGTTQKTTPHQALPPSRAPPNGAALSTPQPHFLRVSPQVIRSPHMPPLGGAPHPHHPNLYGRPRPAQPPAGRPPIAPTAAAASKKPQRRGARAPPPTQKELPLPPGVNGTGSDASIQAAISYLVQQESTRRLPPPKDPQIELVSSDDRLLLTDYFNHLIRQLRLVRFSEADRKTRGGKREKVALGYGGLECVHCIGQPGARKFFWSNVDRLSNSFAEIPGHILKCNYCVPEIKAALLELKLRHAKQMSQMPRGSQKVFFRRVWRRIHDDDPSPSSVSLAPTLPALNAAAATCAASTVGMASTAIGSVGRKNTKSDMRGAGTTSSTPVRGNDVSPNSMERSATKSLASLAKGGSALRTPKSTRVTSGANVVLNPSIIIGPHAHLLGTDAFIDAEPSCGTCKHGAEALAHAAAAQSTGEYHSLPMVMLAISEDKEWLSDHDCFVRRNVEVFAAEEKDVLTAAADRKVCISVGQVGIRCLHCAVAVSRYSGGRRGARGTAVAYPHSISSIYECVKDFHRNHLVNNCPHLPPEVKSKTSELKGTMATSLSSVLRRYYVMAAKALGMVDTAKEGIRAGGISIPLGSSAEQEYALAEPRVELLPADAGHLRARAAKAVAAAAAASFEDATTATTATRPTTRAAAGSAGQTTNTASKANAPAALTGSKDKGSGNSKTKTKVTRSTGAAGLAPEHLAHDQATVATAALTHPSAAPPAYGAPAPVYRYAPPPTSAPPTHYGYHHYGAYGPPGAVQGSFLASAITPLESRKRKAPVRESPREDEGGDSRPSSSRKKMRRAM